MDLLGIGFGALFDKDTGVDNEFLKYLNESIAYSFNINHNVEAR